MEPMNGLEYRLSHEIQGKSRKSGKAEAEVFHCRPDDKAADVIIKARERFQIITTGQGVDKNKVLTDLAIASLKTRFNKAIESGYDDNIHPWRGRVVNFEVRSGDRLRAAPDGKLFEEVLREWMAEASGNNPDKIFTFQFNSSGYGPVQQPELPEEIRREFPNHGRCRDIASYPFEPKDVKDILGQTGCKFTLLYQGEPGKMPAKLFKDNAGKFVLVAARQTSGNEYQITWIGKIVTDDTSNGEAHILTPSFSQATYQYKNGLPYEKNLHRNTLETAYFKDGYWTNFQVYVLKEASTSNQ